MKSNVKKVFLLILFLLGLFFVIKISATIVSAATCTLDSINACGQDTNCLSAVGTQCEQDKERTQIQANTLSSQIAQFDSQIKLTTLKIAQTEAQITLLGGRIVQLGDSLTSLTAAFSARAVETYKLSRFENNFTFILSASDLSDAISRFHYLQKIEEEDRDLLNRLQTAQTTYQGQKTDQETLQKQLTAQQANLDSQKKAKAKLLTDTKGSEAQYESLRSKAQALIASFSTFAANQGGATLLPPQTSCDDWGCYYNQRDSTWGGSSLNGTQYSLASDGCLVTSMAMVLTHYNHKSVTPATINSDPDNFASYYPAYLNYTVYADGITAQRIIATIDSTLSDSDKDPVIVGIYAYGGTHFVVLKSGSGGNYTMEDPFIPNGKDINFTDHYSVSNIFEITKVTIQ
jgi:peptidoglycan hydrolase CwlO-like protein